MEKWKRREESAPLRKNSVFPVSYFVDALPPGRHCYMLVIEKKENGEREIYIEGMVREPEVIGEEEIYH